MNGMVKYHNNLNDVAIASLNPKEQDLFFAICVKANDKGTQAIEIDFKELRELANYKKASTKMLYRSLVNSYDKIKLLEIKWEKDGEFIAMPLSLFRYYRVSEADEKVYVQLSLDFIDLLNHWDLGKFTTFELREYATLRGKYSRALYRMLKQYRYTGFYTVRVDKFRELFDVPKSFSMSNIDERVINPSIEELSKYFEGLNLEKVYGENNKVEKFEFRFKKQDRKSRKIQNKKNIE